MKIYIDNEFKCHTSNLDGIYREIETDSFNGKCDTFIEGYRFVPFGEVWTREDGVAFTGEMISPWVNYSKLDSEQREYEMQLLLEYEANLAELDALVLNLQYNNLTEDF